MTVHNFHDSLAASHAHSDSPWWGEVYRNVFGERLVSMIDLRDDGWAQRGGIDRQLLLADGTVLKVDEKVRSVDYGDFFLEYASDFRKRPYDGWMEKPLTCDFIAYAFIPSQTCYLLPYQLLKNAWDRHKKAWGKEYGYRAAQNNGYETRGICVPIPVVLGAIESAIVVNWARAGAA